MFDALIDSTGAIVQERDFPDAPPPDLPAAKGLRWLPVTDTRPVAADGETLSGPAVTVTRTAVERVWTVRPLSYVEQLAACHAARAAAYPTIGDQLDAAFKARQGDPAAQVAIDDAIARVKADHPKPEPD